MIKKGFTLFEALIIISVVGVIALMLLPNIQKIMPSNNRVMFKKAYTTLQQTINTLINDNVNYPDHQTWLNLTTGIALPRYFNFTAKSGGTFYPNNKFCTLFSDALNTVGTTICPVYSAAGSGTFTTTDGIVWTIKVAAGDNSPNAQFPTTSADYLTKIIVDVNGTDKGPNCSTDLVGINTYPPYSGTYTVCPYILDCRDNPDTFIFSIRYDGKISAGSDACAMSILLDQTKFTK